MACSTGERTPGRQRLRVSLNAFLQVVYDHLHRRYIHLISFPSLDGLLGLFGTKGLAKGGASFEALQGGNFRGLERLESLDLVCQDMEGCLANRCRLGALIVYRNEVPGRH